MTQNPVQPDNFEVIDGIGPKRSKWLQEEFGVRTYGELALLPVDVVEDRLRDFEKRSPKQGEVASWIVVAAKLAQQRGQPSEELKTAKSTEWSAVAHFQVIVEEQAESGLYRTQVIHEESLEKLPLDGLSILAAASWMLDKMDILTVGTPALEAMQTSPEVSPQEVPAEVFTEEAFEVDDDVSTQMVLAKISALKGEFVERSRDVVTRIDQEESGVFSEGMQQIMAKIAHLKRR